MLCETSNRALSLQVLCAPLHAATGSRQHGCAVRSGVRDNIDLATLIDRSKTYWPDHIMGTNLRTYCCLLARPHFKLEDTWVTLTTQ